MQLETPEEEEAPSRCGRRRCKKRRTDGEGGIIFVSPCESCTRFDPVLACVTTVLACEIPHKEEPEDHTHLRSANQICPQTWAC